MDHLLKQDRQATEPIEVVEEVARSQASVDQL